MARSLSGGGLGEMVEGEGKSRVLLTFTANHNKIAKMRTALFLKTSLPPRGAYHKKRPALLGQSKGLVRLSVLFPAGAGWRPAGSTCPAWHHTGLPQVLQSHPKPVEAALLNRLIFFFHELVQSLLDCLQTSISTTSLDF